ncbi:RHS repeat-associated core domain-containing protein [Aestuariibacter sp. AA17]|uniref:RHS repeat-associated core domain-containing protein n=1 Tax=Fluctibacter corallii TaxID=2984329 RepID=A0ABT3ACT2_9ALTE|nr:RHS repeat-associated core domain-containing protein [Aestuariibacter sp. AA17]
MPNPGGTQNHRPYGSSIEGEADDIGYTGHKFDTDLGLSYMQARYYDPVIGRFYSNDPVGFTGEVDTFNRYSYVANNPYKYVDLDGREKIAVQGSINVAKGFGFSANVAFILDTEHYEFTFDRSFSLKSGGAGKFSGGWTFSDSPENPVGNSTVSTLTVNLNHSAGIQLGDTNLKLGDSTNLLGVKFSEDGIENISGKQSAGNAGMSTTGNGSIENNVIGAGVDFSADIKYSKTTTFSIKRVFSRLESKELDNND